VRKYLDADQARLYEMIWQRAVASQMQPAEIERTTVEIEARNGGQSANLRAVGSVVRFDGFIAAYTEDRDEDAEKRTIAACPRSAAAKSWRARRSIRPSTRPSRRRAIRKPRSSSAWKSSASAGPRPMPRR
jgi:DNA topoisomerase I